MAGVDAPTSSSTPPDLSRVRQELAVRVAVVVLIVGFNELFGVAATSSTNAWAVGNYQHQEQTPPSRTLIERWNGTAWKG